MVSVTLAIPEEIKKKMKHFEEMNWSGFIRKAIIEKSKELEWKEKMLHKVSQEEGISEWSVALQKKAREGRFERLRKKGLV